MTVIGHMTDQRFSADLTLEVGPTFLATGVGSGLWGSPTSPPLIFDAGGVGVVAVYRKQGWVVSACANCTHWKARSHLYHYTPDKPTLSEPEITSPSFEDFQRALNSRRN